MKKVISTRMDPADLAKARDGLLAKGFKPTDISSLSQLMRLTFYYGLMAISDNPKAPASEKSMTYIKHKLDQKSTGNTTLNALIKKGN